MNCASFVNASRVIKRRGGANMTDDLRESANQAVVELLINNTFPVEILENVQLGSELPGQRNQRLVLNVGLPKCFNP